MAPLPPPSAAAPAPVPAPVAAAVAEEEELPPEEPPPQLTRAELQWLLAFKEREERRLGEIEKENKRLRQETFRRKRKQKASPQQLQPPAEGLSKSASEASLSTSAHTTPRAGTTSVHPHLPPPLPAAGGAYGGALGEASSAPGSGRSTPRRPPPPRPAAATTVFPAPTPVVARDEGKTRALAADREANLSIARQRHACFISDAVAQSDRLADRLREIRARRERAELARDDGAARGKEESESSAGTMGEEEAEEGQEEEEAPLGGFETPVGGGGSTGCSTGRRSSRLMASCSNLSFRTAKESLGGGCGSSSTAASRSISPCRSEGGGDAAASGSADGADACAGQNDAPHHRADKMRSSFVLKAVDIPGQPVGAEGDVLLLSGPTEPPAASAAEVEPQECLHAPTGGGEPETAAAAPPPPPASSSAAMAAPPAKAAGKGKGKGCGPKGPPPKSSPRASLQKTDQPTKPSRYVNLHWKATQEPEVTEPLPASDAFLDRVCTGGAEGHASPAAVEEAQVEDPMLVRQPIASCPPFPATAFHPAEEAHQCPLEVLENAFRKCEAVVKMPSPEMSRRDDAESFGRRTTLLDAKRLNMLGIMLTRHLFQHKEESHTEAILNIKRSVLQCNFEVVKAEGLSVIHCVLRQHVKDGRQVCVFAERHGEAALARLEYPEHHQLVYELSKVPQIDERLECMLFQMTFKESLVACWQNLETLHKALDVLRAKRSSIRCFFVTAHRLGQSLCQKASRGFQLSTLAKLTHTKSTKMPNMSILHFVLALMPRDKAQSLFTSEDIVLLRNAKDLGTHKVYEECRELAAGLYGVRDICETGSYTCRSTGQAVKIERRRKSLPPSSARRLAATNAAEATDGDGEAAIDTDDHFHEVMQAFVDTHLDDAEDVAAQCHHMVLMYKDLAVYLDDLNNVYPPPRNETSKQQDLLDIFFRFAEVVPQCCEEVERGCLREMLSAHRELG